MSWTKRQFIAQAANEIGMGSYAYDADPSELQDALVKLDAMMAEWETKGIEIEWPLSPNPQDADLDEETDAPLGASIAIYMNLAVLMAPTIGKVLTPDQKSLALRKFNQLLAQHTPTPKRRLQGLPSGSGRRRGTFRQGFNPLPDVKAE